MHRLYRGMTCMHYWNEVEASDILCTSLPKGVFIDTFIRSTKSLQVLTEISFTINYVKEHLFGQYKYLDY